MSPPARKPLESPPLRRAAHRRSFLCDQDGAVAIMAALVLAALMMITAFSVDLGLAFFTKRRLQAATDSAAMSAAQNAANASALATSMLGGNNFATAEIVSLATGSYQPDPAIAVASRFTAGANPSNAVELTTSVVSPLFFARVLDPSQSLTLFVQSGAAVVNEGGLVAGSGLVSLNGGLINALLSGLTGSSISLTAVQYQGLVNSQINALDFMNALATQNHLTAGTYSQLLTNSLSMQSIVNAEIAALNTEGVITSDQVYALQGLTALSAQITGTPTVSLGSLLNAGFWQNAEIGSLDSNSALHATLNLFQLNSFAAQLANGSNFVNATNALSIPGVANVNVGVTVIEPVQGSYYALGPVGTTVHTAQVRLLLTANLLAAASLGAQSAPVSLPIYTEVADGTATLTGISCGSDPSTDTVATVAAQSGVANVYVGSVTPAAMTNFSAPVTVSPATIVNLAGIAKVSGSAQVPIQGNTTTLSFTEQQIQSGTAQTVTSTNMVSNLGQALSSKVNLQATVIGLPIPATAVVSTVSTLLQPVFNAADSLIDPTLQTLGIKVGYLDVTVTGARCGVPALFE